MMLHIITTSIIQEYYIPIIIMGNDLENQHLMSDGDVSSLVFYRNL